MPASDEARILAAVGALAENPLPSGVLKLAGYTPPAWRIRVGEYRIVYTISEERQIIFVESILRRTTQTYRRLQ